MFHINKNFIIIIKINHFSVIVTILINIPHIIGQDHVF